MPCKSSVSSTAFCDIKLPSVFSRCNCTCDALPLHHILDYHCQVWSDQAENDELASREEPRVEFSGEEGQGRFLDLHEHYHTFINSKFGHSKEEAPKEYQDYVTSVTDFSQIPRQHRISRPYRYLLIQFCSVLVQWPQLLSALFLLVIVANWYYLCTLEHAHNSAPYQLHR